MKLLLFIGFSTLLVVLGITFWPRSGQIQSNSTPGEITPPPLVIGSLKAEVIVVEYGDFKCPSCNAFHQTTAKQLRENYIDKGNVKIEFKNLAFIGPDSFRAAEGAYCANKQNKFVEYHDAVYDYMWFNYYKSGDYSAEFDNVLTVNKLKEISGPLGIDPIQLQDCIESGEAKKYVDADLSNARQVGANGTPYFIVGNQAVNGPQPYSIFKTLVDIQLR